MNENNQKVDEVTATREIKDWLENIGFDEWEDVKKPISSGNDSDEEVVDPKEFSDEEGSQRKLIDMLPEAKRGYYKTLLSAVQKGYLVFKDESVIQTLKKPINKKDGSLYKSTLEFDCDIQYGAFKNKLRDQEDSDVESRMNALICALTGLGSGVLYKVRMYDMKVAMSIAVFIG